MLDFTLTPEQLELQRKAREFALKEILPLAWYYDEKDQTPIDVLKKAFEADILNVGIPEKYGGRGDGLIEGVITTEEVAAACPGLATSIFDNSLGIEPVVLSDNEPLKEKYLSKIANEFKLIAFATSETVIGSDVAGMRLKAEKDGNDYILNGAKYWITNAGLADYVSVFATVDPESRHTGICAFLVETGWEGVSSGRPIPKVGQRSSNTAALSFKDVRVPEENMLAAPGDGFVLAMKTFSRTRPSIGAFAVGAARSAMEFAIDYAKERRAFGSRIGNFQAIQFKVAEMYQKIETARLLVWKAAWEADMGMDPTVSASIAKMYATEAALEVGTDALQIFGGFGYTRMSPIEKLMRDIRVFSIYEGTSEIQRIILSGFAMNDYKPVMPSLEALPVIRDMDVRGLEERDQESAPFWRCRMCGHIEQGEEPPEACPICLFPKTAFKKIWPAGS